MREKEERDMKEEEEEEEEEGDTRGACVCPLLEPFRLPESSSTSRCHGYLLRGLSPPALPSQYSMATDPTPRTHTHARVCVRVRVCVHVCVCVCVRECVRV